MKRSRNDDGSGVDLSEEHDGGARPRARARGGALTPTAAAAKPGLDHASARALAEWNAIGLSMFENGAQLHRREIIHSVHRILLGLVKSRCGGNITLMALELKTSRRSIRESLKRYGMYDGKPSAADHGDEPEGEGDAGGADVDGASADGIQYERRVGREEAQADAR